jgi:hypothetical protein
MQVGYSFLIVIYSLGPPGENFCGFYAKISVKYLRNSIRRAPFCIRLYSPTIGILMIFKACEVTIQWVNIVKQAGNQPYSADAP